MKTLDLHQLLVMFNLLERRTPLVLQSLVASFLDLLPRPPGQSVSSSHPRIEVVEATILPSW
jgi:hypothetical protein